MFGTGGFRCSEHAYEGTMPCPKCAQLASGTWPVVLPPIANTDAIVAAIDRLTKAVLTLASERVSHEKVYSLSIVRQLEALGGEKP